MTPHPRLFRAVTLSALALATWSGLWSFTAIALKAVMAVRTGEPEPLLFSAVLSVEFAWLLALAPLGALARTLLRHFRDPGAALGRRARTVVAATSLAFVAFLVFGATLAHLFERHPNAFGFYGSNGPSADFWTDGWNPKLPAMHVVTNAHGYRDEPWEPAARGPRALLVGDSFVWGAGIAEKAGMLDAALERELNRAGGAPWEVLNVAMMPSGLPYYLAALERISEVARPDVLVMSYLGGADDHLLDEPMLVADQPRWLVGVLHVFGVPEDLMRQHAVARQRALQRRLFQAYETRRLRERFARFVRRLEERQVPLIVWEHSHREPLFEPFRAHPLLTFTDWRDARHPGAPDVPNGWAAVPGFEFVGDGHPTERANEAFATVLARVIREATGRGGRTDVALPVGP